MTVAQSSIKNIRITPRKANLVAGLVRGQTVAQALISLKFMRKKAADILFKLIASAAANAAAKNLDPETLTIEHLIVNKGFTLKRWRPVSLGRAHSIMKRTSNISVFVTGEEMKKSSAKKTTTSAKKITESDTVVAAKAEVKKVEIKKTNDKVSHKDTPNKAVTEVHQSKSTKNHPTNHGK